MELRWPAWHATTAHRASFCDLKEKNTGACVRSQIQLRTERRTVSRVDRNMDGQVNLVKRKDRQTDLQENKNNRVCLLD